MEKYVPREIEPKWQRAWEEQGLYRIADTTERQNLFYYFVTMYPYTSGDLHIGHWYAMSPSDAGARYKRMRGYNVLFPMGFDAFGLPAENAAIKRGIHPRTWTMSNIATMRRQLRSLGAMFDWSREIVTCEPDYYRWNQWLFLKLFEKGLAYRALAPVNWCPTDETVLANEQVINGRCERCDTPVVKKDLVQWFFKITAYADELLRHDGIAWPEPIVTMQRNWIGRSEGARLRFPVERHAGSEIEFFTTRPDTIYGATFMVLAPEHPFVERITAPARRAEVAAYVEAAARRTDIERLWAEREKTGVDTGAFSRNLFTGERIPIWVADYVLLSYGTGAIMAVPAHDERDFAFAKRYGLEIREVITPDGTHHHDMAAAYVGEGQLVHSAPFDGLASAEGARRVTAMATEKGWGEAAVTYRLRDWLISRQRYWGTPIPIVYCEQDGVVPVPEKDLPVLLPEDADFQPRGESPLARHPGFVTTTCPRCGRAARRETDTMDTFVDSSWYMYRYANPRYESGFLDPEAGRRWLPVDQYTGGAEHAVLHLLYARFFTKALRDLGLVWFDEPFLRLFNQGQVVFGGRRMSKSRGNVQAPDAYVERYGADAFRLFLMFIGPWENGADWDDAGIEGTARFLQRVWSLVLRHAPARGAQGPENDELERFTHRTIKRVTDAVERFRWNVAVAALMEFANGLQRSTALSSVSYDRAIRTLLLLLAPLAPHVTEELWHRLGATRSIHLEAWPTYDPSLVSAEEVLVVIQVDGKVRDRAMVPAGQGEDELRRIALRSKRVQASLDGASVARVVVVPDKLVNVVTERKRRG